MVVVVADPGFVAGHRTRGLDAPHQSGAGQGCQNVVDSLPGDLGQAAAHRAENRVGVGVRVSVDGLENRDPRSGDPKIGGPQSSGQIGRWIHTAILVSFLD